MSSNPSDQRPIDRLLSIMARLRDPDGGCAWDLEQTFATIAPYTVEEAYEVADAIERGDLNDLREELGDLLLHVVMHAHMAGERRAFECLGLAVMSDGQLDLRQGRQIGRRETGALTVGALQRHRLGHGLPGQRKRRKRGDQGKRAHRVPIRRPG